MRLLRRSRAPSASVFGKWNEPRNDGPFGHQPLSVTLAAVVASRQLSEGRNNKTGGFGVIGKTGQTQAVHSTLQTCHRMKMAADIDFSRLRRSFRCMAQPELTEGLGWMLGQTADPAATVMIPSDELDLTSAERR